MILAEFPSLATHNIRHPKHFSLVAAEFAGQRSFRSNSRTARILKAADDFSCTFPDATAGDMSDTARHIGGVYLASLSVSLYQAEIYGLGCDGGDGGAGNKYFDNRVRILVDRAICNLQVFILLEDETATGEAIFKWLAKTISALDPLWRAKVVGVSTDGANAMTEWSAGLASRVV
jgi:hypothetical protein